MGGEPASERASRFEMDLKLLSVILLGSTFERDPLANEFDQASLGEKK